MAGLWGSCIKNSSRCMKSSLTSAPVLFRLSQFNMPILQFGSGAAYKGSFSVAGELLAGAVTRPAHA